MNDEMKNDANAMKVKLNFFLSLEELHASDSQKHICP